MVVDKVHSSGASHLLFFFVRFLFLSLCVRLDGCKFSKNVAFISEGGDDGSELMQQ
jgi:hypothetical protein